MTSDLWNRLKQLPSPSWDESWYHTGLPDYRTLLGVDDSDIEDLLAIVELWEELGQSDDAYGDDDDGADAEWEDADWEAQHEGPDLRQAPVHAWRALAHLRSVAGARLCMRMAFLCDKRVDDRITEEFHLVIASAGPVIFEETLAYVEDKRKGDFSRSVLLGAVRKLVEANPELRPRAIEIMMRSLASRNPANSLTCNAFLVNQLLHLGATEAAETIERAFAEELVDEILVGTWTDVRRVMAIDGLGLAPDKIKPTVTDLPYLLKASESQPARAQPAKKSGMKAHSRREIRKKKRQKR